MVTMANRISVFSLDRRDGRLLTISEMCNFLGQKSQICVSQDQRFYVWRKTIKDGDPQPRTFYSGDGMGMPILMEKGLSSY